MATSKLMVSTCQLIVRLILVTQHKSLKKHSIRFFSNCSDWLMCLNSDLEALKNNAHLHDPEAGEYYPDDENNRL